MASGACRVLPSTRMVSFVLTLKAGVSRGLPFTDTRPAAIHFSASRREQSPARAITFAIRSSLWLFSLMEKELTYMSAALEEAKAAAARGEVPIGAVLVDPQADEIVARAGNRTIELSDPTAHAEILCIRTACAALGSQRLPGYDLYVTLEPCAMCAGALSFARVRRVIIGAPDAKGGGVLHGGRFYEQPTCHHRPEVVQGIMAEPCGQILKDFFKARRKNSA